MLALLISGPNTAKFHPVVVRVFTAIQYNYKIHPFQWPKRSTSVDPTLEVESIHSQLSVAIFTASRMYVVAEKSSKQFQTPLKLINPYEPAVGFTSLRDITSFNHLKNRKYNPD